MEHKNFIILILHLILIKEVLFIMENICPYCKSDLIAGFIDGGKFAFKWHSENPSFLEKHTVFGGEKLAQNPFIKCFRCANCNKIIIDLNTL